MLLPNTYMGSDTQDGEAGVQWMYVCMDGWMDGWIMVVMVMVMVIL